MSSPNPFAPPMAPVSDIRAANETFQPVRIFAVNGRIGRLRYLAYVSASWLIFSILAGVAMPTATGLFWVFLAGYLVLNVMFLIQRSHDMDLSGWVGVLAFIPLVGLFWLFKGGSPGPNRWGAPPPPNTLGVKILAWLMPIVMVIGVVAAVAVPAYSDYAKRAQAVQKL
jgi:uncharacterized membrane protein YhaH (DUF805 family)